VTETETRTQGKARSTAHVYDTIKALEGAGFPVRRPFPTQTLDHFDPFLLLDEFGPVDWAPGEAVGAPDHPHRGFETVSYILEGRLQHKDSVGNWGRLGPGDVQWMTAGAGVVHSEMPEDELVRSGGRMHGFQLWVNLPQRDKMIRPRYQDIQSSEIPVARTADGSVAVKVIAGEALGSRAVIDTRTPIVYLHFTLQPGGSITQPVPAEFNAFAYVFGGSGRFGEEPDVRRTGQMVAFAGDGDAVAISADPASTEALEVLLIAGEPLREPVARYGPFVMNTFDEIRQAFADYRDGRLGAIDF